MKRVNIYFSDAEYDKLKQYCDNQERTMSDVIRELTRRFIPLPEEKEDEAPGDALIP